MNKGKMSMMMIIISSKMMKNMNPIYMSIIILMLSLMSTNMAFKSTMSSWISFVIILTFSSGMMTLFMYTASLSSNETNKTKKKGLMTMMVMMTLMNPTSQEKMSKKTMKMFSSQKMLMLMATILIMVMLTISMQSHHPNQTMATSF